MKEYFKAQWFSIAVGLMHLGFYTYNCVVEERYWALVHLILAAVWLIMSRVNHNESRIKKLERECENLRHENVVLMDFARDNYDQIQQYSQSSDHRIHSLQCQINELMRRD